MFVWTPHHVSSTYTGPQTYPGSMEVDTQSSKVSVLSNHFYIYDMWSLSCLHQNSTTEVSPDDVLRWAEEIG
jgi:hypothetical protein